VIEPRYLARPELVERLADVLGEDASDLFDAVPDAVQPWPALTGAELRARRLHDGLRRGAEDWHPELRQKATTIRELQVREAQLEAGVRRYMREVAGWVDDVSGVLITQPAAVDDLDWDRWPAVFLEHTRRFFERAMSVGGEDAKQELVGSSAPSGTAKRSASDGLQPYASERGPDGEDFNSPHCHQQPRFRVPTFRRKAQEPAVIVDWTIQSPQAQEFITNHGLELARGINDTSRTRLKRILINAQREGVPMPAIRKRIQAQFVDMSTWRARLIAQTETIRAYSEGALQVYREAGIEKKRWLDGQINACPICLNLDNQERRTDESFRDTVVNGSYDGPPAHPGCRCAVRAVVEVSPRAR
jgi:SPP1 gp7 family putative phage head morphogenesis protein